MSCPPTARTPSSWFGMGNRHRYGDKRVVTSDTKGVAAGLRGTAVDRVQTFGNVKEDERHGQS